MARLVTLYAKYKTECSSNEGIVKFCGEHYAKERTQPRNGTHVPYVYLHWASVFMQQTEFHVYFHYEYRSKLKPPFVLEEIPCTFRASIWQPPRALFS